jgi:hypothetical protein
VTGICGTISIPLECCECLILGQACVAADVACRADTECRCAVLCWYDGQGSLDDCADSCGATGDVLLVDLRVCIDANCPVCLP